MTEKHKAFLIKHGLEEKKKRKLEHAEVNDSSHLEKLINDGLSFTTQTVYQLCSDGQNGANLTDPYTYLGYHQPFWDSFRPQTPEMLKKARRFMEEKDSERFEEEMNDILSKKMFLSGYSLCKQGKRWEITLNMGSKTKLVRASDIREFNRVVNEGIKLLKEK